MRIETIIADDEPLSRELIRSLLDGDGEIDVVAECGDGPELLEAIRERAPRLVFLDVKMPGYSGLEALTRLGDGPHPHVVVVTAYDRFAVRAFELQAVDYVLKPIDKTRFFDSLARAKRTIRRDELADLGERVVRGDATGGRSASGHRAVFVIRDGVVRRTVAVEEVHWIEAANQYVRLHTSKGSAMLTRSMSALQRELDPRQFCRIHRSTIVNTAHVSEVRAEPNGTHLVILADDTHLRLSRRRSRELVSLIAAR